MIRPIKILIVSSNLYWMEFLAEYLKIHLEIMYIGLSKSKSEAMEFIASQAPDVVLLDINLTGNSNETMIMAYDILIKTDTKIIILAVSVDSELVKDAFALGVKNFVLKHNYADLPRKIKETFIINSPLNILRKDYQRLRKEAVLSRLTEAEKQVMNLVKQGYSTTEIGKELTKEESTVKSQIRSILRKFKVDNRFEALAVIKSREITQKYK